MKIKSILLITTGLSSLALYIADNSVLFGLCDKSDIDCRSTFNNAEYAFYFSVVVLMFLLLTYKMHDSVFASWWKFARIGIPVTLVIVVLVSLKLHHSPGGQMQDILDVPFLILAHTFFALGSLIQIYRGYRNK